MLRKRIRLRMFFGPPGSGSVSKRYGSGSGSGYHQAKILRKTLIRTVLWFLYGFLSLKNDVNVASEVQTRGSGSVPRCHGSATLLRRYYTGPENYQGSRHLNLYKGFPTNENIEMPLLEGSPQLPVRRRYRTKFSSTLGNLNPGLFMYPRFSFKDTG